MEPFYVIATAVSLFAGIITIFQFFYFTGGFRSPRRNSEAYSKKIRTNLFNLSQQNARHIDLKAAARIIGERLREGDSYIGIENSNFIIFSRRVITIYHCSKEITVKYPLFKLADFSTNSSIGYCFDVDESTLRFVWVGSKIEVIDFGRRVSSASRISLVREDYSDGPLRVFGISFHKNGFRVSVSRDASTAIVDGTRYKVFLGWISFKYSTNNVFCPYVPSFDEAIQMSD